MKKENFIIDFNKSQKRKMIAKKASEKAIETKINNLKNEINIDVSILNLSKRELYQLACDNYNNYWEFYDHRGDFIYEKHADIYSDEDFLDRITVNFLRHKCSNYDYNLTETIGRVGKNEINQMIKEKTLEVISKAYPFLKEECEHQIPIPDFY